MAPTWDITFSVGDAEEVEKYNEKLAKIQAELEESVIDPNDKALLAQAILDGAHDDFLSEEE